MGKQCTQCGTELREEAKFCSKCGSKCEVLCPKSEMGTVMKSSTGISSEEGKQRKKKVIAIVTSIVVMCSLLVIVIMGNSDVDDNHEFASMGESDLEVDEQNDEQALNEEKDFSIIEGTWRQSSICYPGAADISEIGGGEIVISKMSAKEIEFTIRDYSGNPNYEVKEYKVTSFEMTEEYGEYVISFNAEKGMRGTLTVTELTGKEKTLELAIHSEEETYTRGTGFYNKVSSDVEVEDPVKSEQTETKEDTEVESNDVDAMDELLCLVGVEKHWSGFGSENEYEEHMETVLKPWVMKLIEEHNFYPGTTMIRISEYDRKERIYFVMIYDDLNSGNYAGFYANLNTDEVTFSQGDSNVVIQ